METKIKLLFFYLLSTIYQFTRESKTFRFPLVFSLGSRDYVPDLSLVCKQNKNVDNIVLASKKPKRIIYR